MWQDHTEGKDPFSPTPNPHTHLSCRYGNRSPVSHDPLSFALITLLRQVNLRQTWEEWRKKIMWSTCLIKKLAWKTEMNIQVLSSGCEVDTHLLTFSREELLKTWLTNPVSVDFSYFSWHSWRKSDALLFSLPLSVRSVVWTVSSSELSFKGIIKQFQVFIHFRIQSPNH